MESFLASRQTVAKLGSSVKNLTGSTFTPMAAAKLDSPRAPAANQSGAVAAESSPATSVSGQEDAHTEQPVRVEVIQENGVVGKIVVHCRCGERIELDCLYPE